MIKVSNEELSKIAQFLSGCDDMINGKFILADLKITKLLNMIADSEELYRYISECLTGYDFMRELHRAEVKNGLNGGIFAVPAEESKLVAFVFCLLVECDSKRIDFYTFINENFRDASHTNSYQEFAQKLLVPFKNIISNRFGMLEENAGEVEELTNQYRNDLASEPIFENYNNQTNFENQNFANVNQQNFTGPNIQYQPNNIGYEFQQQNNNFAPQQFENVSNFNQQNSNLNAYSNQQYVQPEEQISANGRVNFEGMPAQFMRNSLPIEPEKPQKEDKDDWAEIKSICTNIESSIYTERKIKQYLKDELLYIMSTIKYATKYKDVKIISALVTAFDELSKKFSSIQFVFSELKNKLKTLYK